MGVKITEEKFGSTQNGQDVKKYTLENAGGMKVSIVDLGACIQSIIIPDKNGKFEDIAMGYDTVKDYENDGCYIGALCGRVANRVSKAQFTIDGVTSNLSKNDGENHIHGGFNAFNKKLFKSEINDGVVEMVYTSPKGEEGYPGTMTVIARYQLNDENEFSILLTAVSTCPTAVNLVQHTYFNLAGHNADSISDHLLQVNADNFTPKKPDGYPTGEIASVSSTFFDFRKAKQLSDIEQVPGETGYDHNLCLKDVDPDTSQQAAKLHHPTSGRTLVVKTNQPGLQVYSSHYVNDVKGKDGAVYKKYGSICLETQNYPDAINQPNFPNAVVRPEDGYAHGMVYKFSTE